MSDPAPSSKSGPYLFRVPEKTSTSLRRYPLNRVLLIILGSLVWCLLVIPIFIMDVFALNPSVVFGVILICVQYPILHFGVQAFLLKSPTRALAETVVGASGQRLLPQDVARALRQAPWADTGEGVASSTKQTMKNGIRFFSKGSEWLIRLAPDLSTGTASLYSEYADAESKSARYVNNAVIILPEDIFKRRVTAGIQLMVSIGAICLSGFILSLTQDYMPISIVVLITAFVAIGMAKILKNPLMSDSHREVSEFISASLQQSTDFKEALFVALRDGTFRRITTSGFAGTKHSVDLLEVLIEPANEPAWVISELQEGKGYRLQRSDGRSFEHELITRGG